MSRIATVTVPGPKADRGADKLSPRGAVAEPAELISRCRLVTIDLPRRQAVIRRFKSKLAGI